MDRLESRWFRLTLLALAVTALVFRAYVLLDLRVADPDMFWHIATGRWIVQNHAIPTVDPFSWWAAPRHEPWVAMEWLFGLMIYGLHSLGGYAAVYWFFALLEGVLALLAYALMRARGADTLWATFLTVVIMVGTLGFMTPRPQMVSYVLVLLVSLLLEKGWWKTALLVVIVGVNFHGGVWPVYVLVFAFYELPKRWWLVAAAAAVTLVNPNPLGVALYPLRVFGSPVAPQIMEWAPTALWTRKGDLLAYVALVLALHGKRVPWRDALYGLAFGILGLSAVRHIAWLYVIVVPTLAPYLELALPKRARAGAGDRLPEREDVGPDAGEVAVSAPVRRSPRLKALEAVLVGTLALVTLLLGVIAVRTTPHATADYPSPRLIEFLKQAGAKRVFNEWGDGGYLILNGLPPLIDGRFDPYLGTGPGGRSLAEGYVDVEALRSDPHDFMKALGVDYALLARGPFSQALLHDPAFTVVESDQGHLVFEVGPFD